MSGTGSNLPLWLALLALAEQATRDHLTGLYNRRYFDETLRDHLAAARRYDRPLSLVLFDIDNFKQINDTRGHAAGDAALKQFAELLRSSSRKADIICRIGGDEFAVILPETGEAAATAFAVRLRQTLDAQDPGFSAATGVSSLPCDDLVGTADADLLARKRESRQQRNR